MDYQALTKDKVDWIVPHLEEDAAVTVVAVTVANARGSANMKWKLTKESMSTPSTMHPASSSNI